MLITAVTGAAVFRIGARRRFRTIQVRPKDVGFPLMQNRTYQRGDPPMTSEPRNLLNPFRPEPANAEAAASISLAGG